MSIDISIPLFKLGLCEQPVQLPVRISRKLISIKPTRHGVLFLLILVAMLIASANYSNNIGFLMTFLLGSMAFVSLAHTLMNVIGLLINVQTAEPVFVGEEIVFPVSVLAGPRARKSLVFAFGSAPCQVVRTKKDGELMIHLDAGIGKRGRFRPGGLKVFSSYPFGLFEAGVAMMDSGINCLVYPRPVADQAGCHLKSPFAEGEDDVSRAATDNFMGFNPYQQGDEIRHIYWKAFSRGQGLFVREFGGQQGEAILLDWYGLEGGDIEWKLSRLCEMILRADLLNLEYGLRLPGKDVAANAGEVHKRQCLKALALYLCD